MADRRQISAYPSPANSLSPQQRAVLPFGRESEPGAMASLPPDPPGAGSGATGADKGGLSTLNLGFLRGLTEKRATRDGQPAKRRGPKPDSKPALTRRQELNRQAQR